MHKVDFIDLLMNLSFMCLVYAKDKTTHSKLSVKTDFNGQNLHVIKRCM